MCIYIYIHISLCSLWGSGELSSQVPKRSPTSQTGLKLKSPRLVDMSCNLNSFKGVKKGTTIGVHKADARSLDYSSIAHMETTA